MNTMNAMKTMTAKFPGKCIACNTYFTAGTQIVWAPGKTKHAACTVKAKTDELTIATGGELERAWKVLIAKFGDAACENNGEVWQYMGTANGAHEFRHRSYKGERRYFRVAAAAPRYTTGCEHCGDEENHDGERCYKVAK
jgi:hypothetical protein